MVKTARPHRCSRHTHTIASALLSSKPTRSYDTIIEQITTMGSINTSNLTPGNSLNGKKPSEIRVALVRPLGSLNMDEEKVMVHEMCEPYQIELLAQVLINLGYQVQIFDQLAEPYDPKNPFIYPSTKTQESFAKEIISSNPDVLGVGTFTYNFRNGLTIAAHVKAQLGIPVIFGGYHTTSVGKQYLIFNALSSTNPGGADVFKQDLRLVFQHGIVDYACVGEGIHTLPEIIAVLRGQKNAKDVSGIAFRINGSGVDDKYNHFHVSAADRVPLEDYPIPHRPLDFDPMMYYSTGRQYPPLLMSTSSGCRFSCDFCSTGVNYHGLSHRSVGSVIKELQLIKARFHSNWPAPKMMVNLTDEDFGANPKRVIELCDAIHSAGLNRYFEFNSFLDNNSILGVSPKTLHLDQRHVHMADKMLTSMHRSGFVYCFVGIESMDTSILHDYHRPDIFPDRVSMVQAAIDRMAQHDILYFGDHISGHPFQTPDMLRQDHKQLLELRRMHYLYLPILAPMPGTALYWKVLWGVIGKGFIDNVTYDDLDANHQVLFLSDADAGDEAISIRDETLTCFFTRPEYEIDADAAVANNPNLGLLIAHMLSKLSMDNRQIHRLQVLAEKFRVS
ncbi:cobalamin-dependent protein [Candidatus Micrarchaeota archaeon]|nr:cobalamin-dependent protein [Candidatus Micrarchaeota archaeon]